MKHLERAFQGKNGVGRYIALLLISFLGGSLIGSAPLAIVMILKTIEKGGAGNIQAGTPLDFTAYGLSNNVTLALILLSFVVVFLLFALLVKPFHQRSLKETINGRKYIRWNRIWIGMIVWGAWMIVCFVVSLLTSSPQEYEFQFNPQALIALLFVILILMPFQTSIEEILMRGYLAQGVARWTKSRWWVLIIPSVLFALMHTANPEVKEFGFWLMMPNYLSMGLFLELISIVDDGIELALGIHFINNALSSILLTHKASALQTDALFVVRDINPLYSLIEMFGMIALSIYVFWRIYKWDFSIFSDKLRATPPPYPQQTK